MANPVPSVDFFEEKLELNAMDDRFYTDDFHKRDDHNQLEKNLFLEAKLYDLDNLGIPVYIEGYLRAGFSLTRQMQQNSVHQMVPRIVNVLVFCYIKSLRQLNVEDAMKANFKFVHDEFNDNESQTEIPELKSSKDASDLSEL